MRKLIAWVFMYSLDGLLADEGTEYWQFCFGLPRDPAELQQKLDVLQSAYAHVMGRVSYQAMAVALPTADHPFTGIMNAARKVVFSRTLRTAEWANTTIAAGDTTAEIDELRLPCAAMDGRHSGGMMFAQRSRAGFAGRRSQFERMPWTGRSESSAQARRRRPHRCLGWRQPLALAHVARLDRRASPGLAPLRCRRGHPAVRRRPHVLPARPVSSTAFSNGIVGLHYRRHR